MGHPVGDLNWLDWKQFKFSSDNDRHGRRSSYGYHTPVCPLCTPVYLVVKSLHNLADGLPIHALTSSDSKHVQKVTNLIYLLGLPELLEDLEGHVVVVEEVITHGEADPRCPLGRPQLKELISRLFIAFQIAHLNLQQAEIAQNLNVLLVPLEGVAVALDGLLVLLVGALQQSVDVPTHVTFEVVPEAASHVIVGLGFAAQAVQGEALHGQRFAVFGKFRIRENLFGEFEAIFVLFLLVTFQDSFEERVFFGRQRLRRTRSRTRRRHRERNERFGDSEEIKKMHTSRFSAGTQTTNIFKSCLLNAFY